MFAGLATIGAAPGGDAVFRVSFDTGVVTEQGVEPVANVGVRLTAGHTGLAAEFVKGSTP